MTIAGFLTWYWPLALAFIAFVLFGIPEWAAIRYQGPTFSNFMATVANAGPIGKLWVFAWGLLVGALAIHFLGWCASPTYPSANAAPPTWVMLACVTCVGS